MASTASIGNILTHESPARRAIKFRVALDSLPYHCRDQWIDDLFGFDPLAEDGADLPQGCVPYMPCSVNLLLAMLDAIQMGSDDVFVDIGAGPGRVTTLVHLLTGAGAIGIEVQAGHVQQSKILTRSLGMKRVATVHGDATRLVGCIPVGTVFFLYCPFGASRLDQVFDTLESLAMARPIRVCCVYMPPIERSGWKVIAAPAPGLEIYQCGVESPLYGLTT